MRTSSSSSSSCHQSSASRGARSEDEDVFLAGASGRSILPQSLPASPSGAARPLRPRPSNRAMTTTTTTSIAVTFLLLLSILSTSSASAFTPRQQLRPIVSAAKLAKRFRGTFAEFCSCDMLVDAAYIGVGAVTGAICRYQIGNIVTRKIQEHPRFSSFMGWHTAGINIMGSFVLGTLAGMPTVDPASAHEMKGITPRARLMAGVGFCGSFTTFSTFSVDVIGMLG